MDDEEYNHVEENIFLTAVNDYPTSSYVSDAARDAWETLVEQVLPIIQALPAKGCRRLKADSPAVKRILEYYLQELCFNRISAKPIQQGENANNQNITTMSSKPIYRPVMILGRDLNLLSERDLIALSQEVKKEAKDLTELGLKSKKIAARVRELEEALALITAKIDEGFDEGVVVPANAE